HGYGIHDGHHRLSDPYRGYGMGTQLGYEKNIDHGKNGFHDHFKHHWYGQKEYGPAQVAGGKILIGTGYGFEDIPPEALKMDF
ncbi:MAG: hypothetical protein AMS23_01190, partial [Bacteroides sp. SM1_62]